MHSDVNDPGRTRTCNPRLRRPMPYPLGHGAFCSLLRISLQVDRLRRPLLCRGPRFRRLAWCCRIPFSVLFPGRPRSFSQPAFSQRLRQLSKPPLDFGCFSLSSTCTFPSHRGVHLSRRVSTQRLTLGAVDPRRSIAGLLGDLFRGFRYRSLAFVAPCFATALAFVGLRGAVVFPF